MIEIQRVSGSVENVDSLFPKQLVTTLLLRHGAESTGTGCVPITCRERGELFFQHVYVALAGVDVMVSLFGTNITTP